MDSTASDLSISPSAINLLDLGTQDFREVWEIQKEIQQDLIAHQGQETLILCEHPSVITLGTSSQPENIKLSSKELEDRGVEAIAIERGGDVTWHGPGQLVAYPLLDLRNRKRDVGWYMRSLEEVIIRTLKEFEINGLRIPGKTGVWTYGPVNASFSEPRKLAAIGVRLSRWCTLHGFSINVLKSTSEGMAMINPCGFLSEQTTSIEEVLTLSGNSDALDSSRAIEDIKQRVIRHFAEVFGSFLS